MAEIAARARAALTPTGSGSVSRVRARYVVFASLSLPRGVLVRLIDEARARGDMDVVFRGLPEGETLAGFAGRLISTSSTEPLPIGLDPVPFRDFGIGAVPAIADRETGAILHGTFFAERFAHHPSGAVVGRTYEIAEPDLIAILTARTAAIDWDAKRAAALARVWARRQKVRLGKAVLPARRVLDLAITLGRDAVAADGTVIARAGTRIDPADHVRLTATLIVFDGTDEDEIGYASAVSAAAAEPILVTTDLGDDAGLEGLRALSARFGRPVYLLDQFLAARFSLAVTPSVVRAEAGAITLSEGLR